MSNLYGHVEVTPPASEPVTTAEFKSWSRIDTSADDTLIAALITTAREWAEVYTSRSFINTTWDYSLDSFAGVIRLPRSPLSSVTSITYVDTGGSSQVLATSVYRVDSAREPGRITLEYGQSWPSVRYVTNNVTIRYVAGYGADATSVPERVKSAIKHYAADMYEHREAVLEMKFTHKNQTAMNLLESFRVTDVGV